MEEDRKSLAQPLFPSVDIQDYLHSCATNSHLFSKICVSENKKHTAANFWMGDEARGLILLKACFKHVGHEVSHVNVHSPQS